MMYEVSPTGSGAATLEDYVAAVRSRWITVLALALAGLLLGIAFVRSTEEAFSASATVLVNPTPVGSLDGNRLVAPNLEREVQVLRSDAVAEAAALRLPATFGEVDPDLVRSDVEPVFVPDSDVIEITFEDTDPEFAAAVVNAFAEAYVQARNDEQGALYEERISAVTEALASAEARQTTISEGIGSLDSQREGILSDTDLVAGVRQEALSGIAEQRAVLAAERSGVASEVRSLSNEITDLTTDRETEAESARLLSTALPPTNPGGIPGAFIVVVATLAGLAVGAVSALIAARLDRSAGTPDEVSAALGTQVLGSVPSLGWRVKGPDAIAMLSDKQGVRAHQARESFRRLRSSVEFLFKSEDLTSLLVTSTYPGEGKSVTSANLAAALAATGQKVALVNADMRRPSLERALGVPPSDSGLSAFLTGVSETLELTPVENAENLFLVPAGPQPSKPGELLSSSRFDLLISGLAEQVDVVIVDTPPVDSTADSLAAAASVGGVLVVVDATSASRDDLRSTRDDLERAGANVLGAVLNRDNGRVRGWNRRRKQYAYA